MAANEPKVTKLKPGEGAGDFVKEGSKNAWGKERTDNPCILKDGSVDPKCKAYQRSVAGRQTAESFIKQQEAQGKSERDIFMSTVQGLMDRKLGYVGAYLDSNNPSRRYTKNQAMKIADAVMTKHGVGEHPGARLTPESDESKKSRKQTRDENKREGKSFEPGRKAMPLRQQRRMPGGRGPGLGPAPGDAETERKVEPLRLSSTQEAINAIKGMSPEEKKAYLEEKLEKSKETQLKRRIDSKSPRTGGRTPGALPLPGSGAASARDILSKTLSQIDKVINVPEEQRDPEKLQEISDTISKGRWSTPSKKFTQLLNDYRKGKATLEDLREGVDSVLKSGDYNPISGRISERKVGGTVSRAKKSTQEDAPGGMREKIGGELRRGGLGGKLETSKEDWLKDDDEDEDTEYIPPDKSSPKGEIPGEMKQILSNELNSQLDIQARVNLNLPYDPNKKIQQRILDPNKLNRLNQEKQRLLKDSDQLDYLVDEAISEVKRIQEIEDDSSDELAKEFLMSSVSSKKPQGSANRPINPPQIKTPEDRQSKSTDEGVMRRAVGLVPRKGAEAPQAPPSPEPEAQPPTAEPAPGEPQQKAPKPKGGFRAPAQARRAQGGGGFTPSPKVVQDVKAAATQAKSFEDFKSYLYNNQPNLFGGAGFETGPSPLEEPEPDQYSKFRGSPAPEPKGAQEAGREEKGGSLFVSPQTAKRRGVKSTIESQSGKIQNPELYTSPRTGPGYGPAGSQQKQEIAEKKEAKTGKYKGMTDEQKKAEVLRLVKEEGMSVGKARNLVGVKPEPSRKPRKPKVSNNAEYQEFAQSIRSMLR